MWDAVVGLERMSVAHRRLLFALASGRKFAGSPRETKFCELLCEASTPSRLLPPYGAMLRSWVTKLGELTVRSSSSGFLEPRRNNLSAVFSVSQGLLENTRVMASRAVVRTMVGNGIGVATRTGAGSAVRAPFTVDEVLRIPAVRCTMQALHKEAQLRSEATSQSVTKLRNMRSLPCDDAKHVLYMRHVGLNILARVLSVPRNPAQRPYAECQ